MLITLQSKQAVPTPFQIPAYTIRLDLSEIMRAVQQLTRVELEFSFGAIIEHGMPGFPEPYPIYEFNR